MTIEKEKAPGEAGSVSRSREQERATRATRVASGHRTPAASDAEEKPSGAVVLARIVLYLIFLPAIALYIIGLLFR
ncbi:MAG: hypothetical protein KatS3mg076_1555 [Candidatus Binatia bacterium]|nr:MAG: hypothetical protein KatS3mg076_1555 [Candidatus Binatia bacterium]